MDRKPWDQKGSHRAPFGGERRNSGRDNERRFSDRRDDSRDAGGRSFDRDSRPSFGERRQEFGDRRPSFGDRRSNFGDRRSESGDRRQEFGDRRPSFGDRRSNFGERRSNFGDRRQNFGERRQGFGGERREEFGVRSGPRARAFESRRFAERTDFAKKAVVKLDADVADYFENAEAVNAALRAVIAMSRLVKAPKAAVKPEVNNQAEEATQAPVVTAQAEEVIFSDDDFDDVEDGTYGDASEEKEVELQEDGANDLENKAS